MKKYILLSLIIATIAVACSKVPVSGRKQLAFLPESELVGMSLSQYREVLNEAQTANNTTDGQMVRRVGNNIAAAVESYMRQNKMGNQIKNFKWEFNLIQEDVPNAWAMPGGKVAIYTGILPYTKTEDGLAVVMGHEVAHAIARHGNERMSMGLLQQLGGVGLAVAMRNKPAQTQALFMGAYGVGAQFGAMLPFSRKHETEADELGLIFMAMAGYNPKEAPSFWSRMSRSGGAAPPEFMSTHPSHTTRSRNLNSFMPKAMKYYNPNANKNSRPSQVGSSMKNQKNTPSKKTTTKGTTTKRTGGTKRTSGSVKGKLKRD